MLEDLTKELHESQTTVEETEKRKLEAEKALQSAISGRLLLYCDHHIFILLFSYSYVSIVI